MSEHLERDDAAGQGDAARHDAVRAAFATFRADPRPLRPRPAGRLPWVRARARRRRRSVLVSGLAVACVAVAALTASDQLRDRLLSAGDLGWGDSAAQAVSTAGGFPGTTDSAAYLAASASSATAPGEAGDWELSQTVVQVVPDHGESTYAAATALLSCTSPEHDVALLTAGAPPVPWLGAKETTTESDGGDTQVQWVVYARSQDVVTQLTVSSWGEQAAMVDAHLSAAWLQQLAVAAATRLSGRAPTEPVGLPRTDG